MTYKKTKLASTFTWITAALSTLIIVALVFGLLYGWGAQEERGLEGIGIVVIFVLGLAVGGAVVVVGLALSITAATMYKKSAENGTLTIANILSTVAAVIYTAFFLLAVIILFDIGFTYSTVLGVVAIVAALINIANCVFCWISRKELV